MFPVEDSNFGSIKLTGRSKAKVINISDPLKRGRIIVDHPLLGQTVWIDYLKTPNSFNVPEVGDIVFVECDGGFSTHPIAWGNVVKGADGNTDIPEEFQRINPTNRGFYTKKGHLVELDDGDGIDALKQGIRITSSNGNKIHLMEDAASGKEYILIEDVNGQQIKIDSLQNKITIEGTGKISISASTGMDIEATTGNITTTADTGNIASTATAGDVTLSGSLGKLKLSTGKVALGGPTAELLDLFDQTLTALSTTTAAGFGAPISSVATFAAIQTQLLTIKGTL